MTSSEDCHVKFTAWAQQRGIIINDRIKPTKFPGRGVGIASLSKIHAGEQLVFVPRSALLTIDEVPSTFQDKHEKISVHGLLASFLTFGPSQHRAQFSEWQATWPTLEDLRICMPILWPFATQYKQPSLDTSRQGGFYAMPYAMSGLGFFDVGSGRHLSTLLKFQETNLTRDWKTVSRALSTAKYEDYVYYWLMVNTRSFYYELPSKGKVQPREDRMVLCPFADYFNHADHGCLVEYDSSGITVTSDRDYVAGHELYTSYGNHSNDFLLAEYGFFLQENAHDSIPLDDLVFRNITDSSMRDLLDRFDYYGEYTLYPAPRGPCHRTAVAIRTQTLSGEDWNLFVLGETPSVGEVRDEELANEFLVDKVLRPYLREVEGALREFDAVGMRTRFKVNEEVWETLRKRWAQIRETLEGVLDHFGSGSANQTDEA